MNSTSPQFNTKHQKQRMSLPSFSPLLFLVDPPIILARWHRVGPAAGWYRGWWLGCFWECFVSLPMGHRGIVPDDIDVGYPKAKAWIFRKKIWKLPNSAFLTYTPPTKKLPRGYFLDIEISKGNSQSARWMATAIHINDRSRALILGWILIMIPGTWK